MKPLFIISTLLLLSACTSESTTSPSNDKSETANIINYANEFTEFYCAKAPNCTINDISNNDLEYGSWLARQLSIPALQDAITSDITMSEIGPNINDDYVQLGIVRYKLDTQDKVLKTLESRPHKTFVDNKVLMQYRVINEGNALVILFGGNFDVKTDNFFDNY